MIVLHLSVAVYLPTPAAALHSPHLLAPFHVCLKAMSSNEATAGVVVSLPCSDLCSLLCPMDKREFPASSAAHSSSSTWSIRVRVEVLKPLFRSSIFSRRNSRLTASRSHSSWVCCLGQRPWLWVWQSLLGGQPGGRSSLLDPPSTT